MSDRPCILVVDDEPNMCRSLQIMLAEDDRYKIVTETSGRRALDRIDPAIDLLITDLSMPDVDGIALLRRAKQVSEDIQVVIMTAYSTVESAVEAMKLGALEYLIKPFSNDEMLLTVEKALRMNELQRENRRLKAQLDDGGHLCGLVGKSEAMQELFFIIERAAASEATVLITGESGTGKELVARAIHGLGRRRGAPFVPVNCAAITETLLESELFGHERGAFTGAVRQQVGRIEQADGGTLFLDEIGEMSNPLQTKVLRALEERAFHRVGGTEEIHVDVRFVAATNADLEAAIGAGRFREDLFYRLNVLPVCAPALRQRFGDIPLLVEHFLQETAAVRPDGQRLQISPDALDALLQYNFPGNVRELRNIIERAHVLAKGPTIEIEDLPLPNRRTVRLALDQLIPSLENGWQQLQAVIKDLERQLLERALSAYHGRPNAEIAAILGTSRRVLELRLQEHALTKTRTRG